MTDDLASPETKLAVYRQFVEDRPEVGSRQAWYERAAEEHGVAAQTIRQWIARQQELEFFHGPNHVQSVFEGLAHLADVYAVDAIATLGRNLNATRRVRKTTREGEVLEYEDPDFNAQNVAAEKVLKIYGAFAPDKLELSRGSSDPRTMTTEQLEKELAKYTRGAKVIKIDSDGSGREDQGAGDTEGTTPPDGGAGSPVLADEMHEDGG